MTKKIIATIVALVVIVFGIFGISKLIHNAGIKPDGEVEVSATEVDKNTDTAQQAEQMQAQEQAQEQAQQAEDILEDLKLSLSVDLDADTLEKMYANFVRDFLDNSMPNKSAERTLAASKVGWGDEGQKMYDAVSFPFSAVQKGKAEYSQDDIDQMYLELQEEIMRNPVMGDMVVQGMQYLALTDGTTMADLNDGWTQDFLAIYDENGVSAFVTYHTRYWEKYGFELPHDGEDVNEWKEAHPNAPTPEKTDLELITLESETIEPAAGSNGRIGTVSTPEYKLFVTEYYARTAKRILAWLDRCNIDGVKTHKTITHWPLNSTTNANDVRTYRNTDKDYIDAQPALVFNIQRKDGTKEVLFGFNIYDLRFEVFERTSTPVEPGKPAKQPDPTPTSKKTPDPKPTPKPIPDPDPTPNPDPDPNPDPTPNPDPDPNPTKDPTKDPVHNNNANTGGGEGQGETPKDPVPDPSKNDMQNAGGGEDKNQGHSDPSTVTPGSNPSSTHKDNVGGKDDNDPTTVENHDQNQMNYGEENHNQSDSVTDPNGNVSNPSQQPAGGEFSEPPI